MGTFVLPAIQDDGTALWPEKHDIETLRRMEQAAPYVFAGRICKSAPPDGGTFKPDNSQESPPAGISDGSARGTFDRKRWQLYSRRQAWRNRRWAVYHRQRRARSVWADERDGILKNTGKRRRENKISIPQDPGQAGKSQTLYLTRQLAGFSVSASPESGDKVTRAEPFAAQVNIGNVMVLDDGTGDRRADFRNADVPKRSA